LVKNLQVKNPQKVFCRTFSSKKKENGKRKLPETIAVAAELKTPNKQKFLILNKNNKTSKQIDARILRFTYNISNLFFVNNHPNIYPTIQTSIPTH
jgi:hypothetical protein